MDTAWIGAVLSQYGLPGVIIIGQFYVIGVLYKRVTELVDRIIEGTKTDVELANSLKNLTDIIKERR